MEKLVKSPAAIFVFTNGRHDVVGLSVLSDGSNLPMVCDTDGEWRFAKFVPFGQAGIKGVTVDNELALANLRDRGYHLGHTEAVILKFPSSSEDVVAHS